MTTITTHPRPEIEWDEDDFEDLAELEARDDAEMARGERGMTTAEYAVGTVAAASFGTVLYKILTDEQIRQKLLELILKIIEMILTGLPTPF